MEILYIRNVRVLWPFSSTCEHVNMDNIDTTVFVIQRAPVFLSAMPKCNFASLSIFCTIYTRMHFNVSPSHICVNISVRCSILSQSFTSIWYVSMYDYTVLISIYQKRNKKIVFNLNKCFRPNKNLPWHNNTMYEFRATSHARQKHKKTRIQRTLTQTKDKNTENIEQ